ncbi:MAG: transcription elongation factor Spt5 [Methanomassiliicoccales archaeon]
MLDKEMKNEGISTGEAGRNIMFIAKNDEKRLPASGQSSWKIQLKTADASKKKVKMRLVIEIGGETEGAPEWSVKILDARGVLWDSDSQLPPEIEFIMEGSQAKELELEITAPKGARYNDWVRITTEAFVDGAPDDVARMSFFASARQSILALKTSIGHERNVADSVASKAKSGKAGIFAILAPSTLRGYVLIEGMNTDLLREAVRGIRRSHGLVEGETDFGEIDHFLTPKPLVSGVMEGDVVELVAGPFKGEKARVKQIDESKEEITVELFEAMVPIPITVRGDHVRVIEKEH